MVEPTVIVALISSLASIVIILIKGIRKCSFGKFEIERTTEAVAPALNEQQKFLLDFVRIIKDYEPNDKIIEEDMEEIDLEEGENNDRIERKNPMSGDESIVFEEINTPELYAEYVAKTFKLKPKKQNSPRNFVSMVKEKSKAIRSTKHPQNPFIINNKNNK